MVEADERMYEQKMSKKPGMGNSYSYTPADEKQCFTIDLAGFIQIIDMFQPYNRVALVNSNQETLPV